MVSPPGFPKHLQAIVVKCDVKKNLENHQRPDVVDVADVREIAVMRWFNRSRKRVLLAAALAVIAASAWWTYVAYLKPNRDLRLVEEATSLLTTNPKLADWEKRTREWSNEKKLIQLSVLFRNRDFGIPSDVGSRASRAALDLAIHHGSWEARLELGKALRDGEIGEKDPKAALVQFQLLLDDLQTGLKTGDQDALFVYSLMLKEGLGVQEDTAKAHEILRRVALSRDHVTMKRIGTTAVIGGKEDRDLDLAKSISTFLIQNGHTEAYTLGSLACSEEFANAPGEVASMVASKKGGDDAAFNSKVQQLLTKSREANLCRKQFYEAAADRGNKDAISSLAEINSGGLSSGQTSKNFVPWSGTLDPETQGNTGYLKGTTQDANGGLSTFTIDNSKGGRDAVVRLYINGNKPAARNMFVKNGDRFTAQTLPPGAYLLRYRYIGSDETFEADETFYLTENRTDNGTRFSRATVTLYGVASGNMKVKKVSESDF